MNEYLLNENDSVDATVIYSDRNAVVHESWDTVDMIESGYTFQNMVADYKNDGAKKIVITIQFGE